MEAEDYTKRAEEHFELLYQAWMEKHGELLWIYAPKLLKAICEGWFKRGAMFAANEAREIVKG